MIFGSVRRFIWHNSGIFRFMKLASQTLYHAHFNAIDPRLQHKGESRLSDAGIRNRTASNPIRLRFDSSKFPIASHLWRHLIESRTGFRFTRDPPSPPPLEMSGTWEKSTTLNFLERLLRGRNEKQE
jgi:hypothetical protein